MRFNAIEKRISPSSVYGDSWYSFLAKLENVEKVKILGFREVRIINAIKMFITNCAISDFIGSSVACDLSDRKLTDFITVRTAMIDAHHALKRRNLAMTSEDIMNVAVLPYAKAGNLSRVCLDVYPSLSQHGASVLSALHFNQEETGSIGLFAYGLSHASILRQVLHDLRYPWPGQVATENAPALIKSFWWRPPFGAERIVVYVTPDNPELLDSLCAEFPEPFVTEWGQTLSVTFESFHSRD